jgi:hypothetical protein
MPAVSAATPASGGTPVLNGGAGVLHAKTIPMERARSLTISELCRNRHGHVACRGLTSHQLQSGHIRMLAKRSSFLRQGVERSWMVTGNASHGQRLKAP